jgi:hypothetical protein
MWSCPGRTLTPMMATASLLQPCIASKDEPTQATHTQVWDVCDRLKNHVEKAHSFDVQISRAQMSGLLT